jgi:hypothetical protein
MKLYKYIISIIIACVIVIMVPIILVIAFLISVAMGFINDDLDKVTENNNNY